MFCNFVKEYLGSMASVTDDSYFIIEIVVIAAK